MANQIVIAGGQVGSTNWVNTEVADNEYPVMGSGIKAALDAIGGGGFSPFIINVAYDDQNNEILDVSDADIYAAITGGTEYFALFDEDSLVQISRPGTDAYGNTAIYWYGGGYIDDNGDNTVEIGKLRAEWNRGNDGTYSTTIDRIVVTVATQ